MGMGIGDWGWGIGDWAQSPIPNPHINIKKLCNNLLYILYISYIKDFKFNFTWYLL